MLFHSSSPLLPLHLLTAALLLPLLLAAASTPYRPISKALYDDFDELARIVDIAYCVGSLNTGIDYPFDCLSFCKDFPDFRLVQTWNTGPTLSDSCGYVAVAHPPPDDPDARPRIIVAFRGTYSIANAVADLSLVQQEYVPYPSEGHSAGKCEGCGVHAGFLRSWTQTEKIIGPVIATLVKKYARSSNGYRLELVGHSLGGAVAALAGLDFAARGWNPRVTTFGEPRVGNKQLAEYFNSWFDSSSSSSSSSSESNEIMYRRLTHIDDPVPLLPWVAWGYSQHAGEYYIDVPTLPYTQWDIRPCEGNEDPTCAAKGTVKVMQLFLAHRDYFHRLGLCVPQNTGLRDHILVDDDDDDDDEAGRDAAVVEYNHGHGRGKAQVQLESGELR